MAVPTTAGGNDTPITPPATAPLAPAAVGLALQDLRMALGVPGD
ncbi:MAG TPA: hypothetical protein VE152_10080 [Acidimicrobiales bacterium]|nr:hypothetical protein [Acidimicrobiales bacterium]